VPALTPTSLVTVLVVVLPFSSVLLVVTVVVLVLLLETLQAVSAKSMSAASNTARIFFILVSLLMIRPLSVVCFHFARIP
jgi:hypothetical protein